MRDERKTAQQYLVCDASGNVDKTALPEFWTRSPLRCLEAAIETVPDMVLIRFPEFNDPMLQIYMELCEMLKDNRRTRGCLVTALMPGKNTVLVDRLHSAGVDYARTVSNGRLDAGMVQEIMGSLNDEDRISHCRNRLCPYLRNVALDEDKSMTLCGAYLDRMVLGGRRLHELCETENHAGCEYYQNPRVRS